jgi:nicotinate-nucleotide pyrophosphorylase (carboxylating)
MDLPLYVKEHISRSLREDIVHGDITSLALIPENDVASATFIAKEDFVLCGLPVAREVFYTVNSSIRIQMFATEGDRLEKGESIAKVTGSTRSLLAAERVALNYMQRLSGIATLTSKFVEAVEGLNVKILDTRKTTPGLRFLEKYAVKTGGGHNHRFGLYDGILIKDNHIKAAGGIKQAVEKARNSHRFLRIEVETETTYDVIEALDAQADIIMLDNMSVEKMHEAVEIAKGKALLEASGNVTLKNVRSIAETGVDVISVGALTHSARAADISMKLGDAG